MEIIIIIIIIIIFYSAQTGRKVEVK